MSSGAGRIVLSLLAAAVWLHVPVRSAATAQSELVIVKEGTKQYHRPGCEVIRDGKGVLAMTRAQAEGRDFKAHAECDPAVNPPGASGKPAAPVYVYVDGAGKHYHKEKCARLGKDARKVSLQEAGRKHWPCTVCKPPIRKRDANVSGSSGGTAADPYTASNASPLPR